MEGRTAGGTELVSIRRVKNGARDPRPRKDDADH